MRWSALSTFAVCAVLGGAGCSAEPGLSGSASPGGPALAGAETRQLPAFRETDPVPHGGDAADDPAIWIDRRDPARSTVIGTDKRGGLAVYDLSGRELQYIAGGKPNNVDLRHGFPLEGRRVAIVAAEDRRRDRVVLYRVDPVTRRLAFVAAHRVGGEMEVYGSCMYRSRTSGAFHVFVSSKQGWIRQFRVRPARGGRVQLRLKRSFDVGDTTEGCVADDAGGQLYVGEENRGIWRYGGDPEDGRRRTLVDSTRRGGNLTADVEGLALVELGPRRGYLVASNQGANSYNLYRRGPVDTYVTTFRVIAGDGVDGALDTDGIDATTRALGSDFPTGLFVVQDGSNDGAHQNFKLVRWDLASIVAAARRDGAGR